MGLEYIQRGGGGKGLAQPVPLFLSLPRREVEPIIQENFKPKHLLAPCRADRLTNRIRTQIDRQQSERGHRSVTLPTDTPLGDDQS
jgi:hypothetical protein